ncbi:hypothetical protein [Flavobacterium sp. 5]|uniref:hypothetical protein n=1 Tax=Flavobacterium sp. 5 TaxID=2035199 RepID=UPI000C2BB787|nr:hypothetical protein [Flavobacterium sp. 5]PKB15258.1 hypothetical protein CLU82_0322 [Flavobacterium sp. 5]
MKEDVKYKLDQIANVWNDFIWEYGICKKTIKFTSDIQTNYFGDILSYFQDTFDIIFDNSESKSYSDKFSNQISLLQSIYVQQDFIEELLIIFKCGIDKGELKKDSNYFINREIRNELVGHPIRKNRGQFISSCLFSYEGRSDKIAYLRYHKDNNYEFESMEFEISDIVLRHRDFLIKYFDKILDKLKRILSSFVKELENLEVLLNSKSFEELLNILTVFYETIFKYDFIYDKESLLNIYSRKDEHRRYQNIIDNFYRDLKSSLKEKKEYAIEVFEPNKIFEEFEIERPEFDIKIIKFIDASTRTKTEKTEIPVTYNYELGKIATKRNIIDFRHFGGTLKRKCAENQTVLNELEHMELNIDDEIEYFSAFKLIWNELNNDD